MTDGSASALGSSSPSRRSDPRRPRREVLLDRCLGHPGDRNLRGRPRRRHLSCALVGPGLPGGQKGRGGARDRGLLVVTPFFTAASRHRRVLGERDPAPCWPLLPRRRRARDARTSALPVASDRASRGVGVLGLAWRRRAFRGVRHSRPAARVAALRRRRSIFVAVVSVPVLGETISPMGMLAWRRSAASGRDGARHSGVRSAEASRAA